MPDRRQSARDKVIYGSVAEIDELGTTADCVARNISEQGASLEFNSAVKLTKGRISLTIVQKGRSLLAKLIWWRDNFIGVAFSGGTPSELPVSDIEERLRKSEQKKRQLQRRIKELIGED
jgi:PilZ domain